ncbi:hypothetical protein J3E69DRAFT_355598 [Trichoderma sp. SZMC 28015]
MARQPSCYCGKTPTEASSRGCIYDHMAAAWLPNRCRDEGLAKIFEELANGHNWTYFNYPEVTKELSIAEVSSLAGVGVEIKDGVGVVRTTIDWHLSHCLYTWWKLARVASTGTLMGPKYSNEGHVKHCIQEVWKHLNRSSGLDKLSSITGVYLFPE